MSGLIQVAIPVLKGRTSVLVDKGRPWSTIEHLILEALARQAWTAFDLSKASRLPRRVVIETIIRLMRAGWVDLSESKSQVVFRANSFGTVAAGKSELPKTFERMRRQINFTVDMVDGGVFRNREWYVYDAYALQERQRKETIVWVEPESVTEIWNHDDFYETLLDDDETLVSADPSGYARKYVLASVTHGNIDGLPDRELPNLRIAILAAAESVKQTKIDQTHVFPTPGIAAASRAEIPPERSIHFNVSDLVLDGDAHRKLLKKIFENAVRNIYIHSTFIDEGKVLNWLPDIANAAKRGVTTHIFWGQSEDAPVVVSSRISISNLARNRDVQAIGDSLVIHPFSTGSHAKLIVADSGKGGSYIAVVGSCNWFTSGFTSYEASVVLRDAKIVRDIVRLFSDLAFAHNGIWSNLSTELVKISKHLRETSVPSKTNAKASIVVGAQHEHFVLRARDEAKKRVFVASHRLGHISIGSVLTPIMTGAEASKIEANVYYGRTTGGVWGERQDAIADEAALSGVSVELIKAPRLHAKMLAWDDDCILITSLNWLSATSGDVGSLKEIGVYIEADSIAEQLISNFRDARENKGQINVQ